MFQTQQEPCHDRVLEERQWSSQFHTVHICNQGVLFLHHLALLQTRGMDHCHAVGENAKIDSEHFLQAKGNHSHHLHLSSKQSKHITSILKLHDTRCAHDYHTASSCWILSLIRALGKSDINSIIQDIKFSYAHEVLE